MHESLRFASNKTEKFNCVWQLALVCVSLEVCEILIASVKFY